MATNKMDYFNPNYKIGIKELTSEQLAVGLPNYDEMLKKITKIREESQKVDKAYLENNFFETLKFDNIFSILGGRGAGKTSILFTLYKHFKSDQRNIMVPIVMPELLDRNESIVSWILSAIEVCLDKFEEKIINNSKCCNEKETIQKVFEEYELFDRCVFNRKNKLRTKFNDLKQAFYDNENKEFGSNYSENTELMAKSVQSGFEIIHKFISFWNTLINVYQKFLETSQINDPNPLIFLFIDDADLKPEIINELLFVIPKYFSHPNVVVFISGAQKTLKYAVKNYMYKSITQKPLDLIALMNVENSYNYESYKNEEVSRVRLSDLRYGKEYDKIEKLTDEILRKLFPVYNRFHVTKYDKNSKKLAFQVFKDDTSTCNESIRLSEKLSDTLEQYYMNVMSMHGAHKDFSIINDKSEPSQDTLYAKEANFKLIEDNKKGKKIFGNGFYVSFFGQYSRDISAVYLALTEMLKNLTNILENLYNGKYGQIDDRIPLKCIEDSYSVIIKFIRSVVTSNIKLKMFNSCVEEMVKTQLLHWQLYIDYAKVLEVFKQKEYISSNLKNPDPFIEMLCLLNFVEQIIVVMMPQRRKSHGINEIHEFISFAGINVIQYSDDINTIFNQYYVFNDLNIVPRFDKNKIEHQNNFLTGVEKLGLLENVTNHSIFVNRDWIILLSEVVFRRTSPIAKLEKHQKDLLILSDYRFMDKAFLEIRELYYSSLKNELFKTEYRFDSQLKKKHNIANERIEEMETLMIELDNYVRKMVVFYSNDKEQLLYHTTSLDMFDNKKIKKEVASLITCLSKGKIFRHELITRMNNILAIIETDDYEYLELLEWYKSFELYLQSKIRIHSVRTNSQYYDIILRIKAVYEDYIKSYVSMIFKELDTENKSISGYFKSEKINKVTKPIIDVLSEQEWRRLIESERYYE